MYRYRVNLPPCTLFVTALDVPPMKESVETLHPVPKLAVISDDSKSLTKPDSESGGGVPFLSASSFSFC